MELKNIQELFSIIFQYLISPLITGGFMLYVIQQIHRLGKFSEKFDTALEDIKELKKESRRMSRDIDIIKTYLVSHLGVTLPRENI